MAAKDTKLMVFAHLGTAWAPCGQLVLTEEADRLLASSFAYGLNYLKRSDALEVDPVSLSLSLADREAVRAKRLLPANQLSFFGGIRDAAPDAWGRRAPQGFDPRRGRCAVPGQIRKPPRRLRHPRHRVRQWRGYLTEAGVPAAEQDKIAPAIRHIDDVSTAALRKLLP